MKRITKIEENRLLNTKKLRVAAYCRVSTASDEQLISLEAQKAHYENYIKSNEEWEFAGLYYDEGVSGTKKAKRSGLLSMMADCEKGKIDFIITKSISRFARNTMDCLEMVRKLLDLNIYIYFEKENLNSGAMESELMLSILSSIAESESVSISENSKWATKRRFQNGTFVISYPPFGYDNVDGKSNTRAMYNLALMYIKGDGVEHNYEKAVSLLNQALEKQSPQAQLLMAIAYKSGFMVKKDKKQSKVLIRKVDNSGKRFFLYSWYLTFANKNMVINADYIPNQIAPESEVQLGRVRGLTFNENEAINPYRDLESYIYHITANDPVSEKALQMVIRMYHTGKGAPQSSVLSNYWSSYILPVDSSRTNYDNNENDYYDLQAELERKFDIINMTYSCRVESGIICMECKKR